MVRPSPVDFDYDLPPDRIAQRATEPRDAARLMRLDRVSGALEDRGVRDLPDLLEPGDLLVANDARVVPARLAARRESGALIEVVLLDPTPSGAWRALLKSRGKVKVGERLILAEGRLAVEGRDGADWRVRLEGVEAGALMARHGKAPLPPYIRRPLEGDPDREGDLARYQTVFAREPGAVAAPTAGLHFTPALLEALATRGLGWATLTLQVGPGTFRTAAGQAPDPERYAVPEATVRAVAAARAAGRRVVAVGTTSARALETWAATGEREGLTRLVILPGHAFKTVDALLTNFHLPKSSLLALVAAFAGHEAVMRAYRHALASGYRFYSYGDAMLVC